MRLVLKLERLCGALLFLLVLLGIFVYPSSADAVTCTISTDQVIDQAYVTANTCTSIEIQGNVSTTWIGTVDLGGGTVTVKTGYTMTMGTSSEMILGASDDFTIETGATTTHTQADPNGLKITARNITVTGILSANEKGCSGSTGASSHGYGPNTSTGVCAHNTSGAGKTNNNGGGGGSGGAYGGASSAGSGGGASVTTVYGDSLGPTFLGSGGGQGYYASSYGGAGGGRIALVVSGTLQVDGSIVANGGNGAAPNLPQYNGAGGGSGGSIAITAASITGSGYIRANGGNGGTGAWGGGGGGGGGRVFVVYDASSFTLSNIQAAVGTGGSENGKNGTTYILNRTVDDGGGDLTITSGFDFPASGDYTRDSITIGSGANLGCATSSAFTVSSTAWLVLSDVSWSCSSSISSFSLGSVAGISTTNTTLTFSAVTSVIVSAPFWNNVTTTISATQSGSRGLFDIGSNLVLRDFTYTGGNQGAVDALGGLLTFPNAYSLSLVSSTLATGVSSTLMTALTLDSLSSINASEKGCRGSVTTENGFGPNTSTGVCAITTAGYGKAGNGGGGGGGGAAHGGTGGAGVSGGASQTTTYDSNTSPVLPGSGGGGGYFNANGAGGAGGGRIYLVISGTATIDGSIKANGGNGVYVSFNGGGGGSGGSVYIQAGTLAGSGTLTANGGAGGSTGGGGGGGGYIALRYSATSFSGTSSTTLGAGGTGAGSGSDGSIYTLLLNQSPDVPTSLGQAALVDGSTTGTNNPVMTFSLTDPDGADTVKYQIQIDDSSDFSSPVVDYTSALAAQGTQTFQVGQSVGSGSYTVGSSGQTLSDGSYYWRVKTIDASAAESSYETANGGSVAFIVDTVPRYLRFANETAADVESISTTSVRVFLDVAHFENVSVDYSVTGGSAVGSGEDYTLTAGTLTIPAGSLSGTFSLTIVDDAIDEPNEDIQITLASPVYATIGSNTSTAYTITDNDVAGVSFSATSGAFSEGGASSTYTIVLDTQPTSTVQVILTPDAQLTVSTTTLTFTNANWSTPQTVTLNALDDTSQEGTHTGTIAHTVSVPDSAYAYGYNSLSGLSSFAASIADNETASIAVSASTMTLTEGQSGTYTIVMGTAPTSTVTIAVTAGSGLAVSPSTLSFTTSNWATPQTVTVTAVDDTSFTALTRSASVTNAISSAPSGYADIVIGGITVTITDNDSSGGGGASAGSGSSAGMGVPSTFTFAPTPTPTPSPSPAPTPTSQNPVSVPIIAINGVANSPFMPSQIVQVLNPRDPDRVAEVLNDGLRDMGREGQMRSIVTEDARTFQVTLGAELREPLVIFLAYGLSEATASLGTGERRALIRDAMQTMRTADISPTDLERMARGVIPEMRNLAAEREQLSRVRATFRTIYGHDPVFSNPEENMAWNTLMYRIRFRRNLVLERQGIAEFLQTFGRAPKDPFQWATVRVLGYVNR